MLLTSRLSIDTADGIADWLTTYQGMLQLIEARRAEYAESQQPLHEFFLFDKLYLDSRGSYGIIKTEELTGELAGLRFDAVTAAERVKASFTRYYTSLPRLGLICSECRRGWDLNNFTDFTTAPHTESVPRDLNIGRTLEEITDAYNVRTDVVLYHHSEIQNEAYISNENKRGWRKCEGTYRFQPGDETFLTGNRYFHNACRKVKNAREISEAFRGVFEKAGIKIKHMEATPNQYCSCVLCAPWFNVQTNFGTILIGWRKHVINLDWMRTSLDKIADLKYISGGDNVTQGSAYIHCDGYDKAVEYLKRLATVAQAVPNV
jgi:hypothetical protein